MANDVTKLAYDEARAALKEQDATLSNVRNRATGLLAAAAIATTSAAAVGLLNVDPTRGRIFPSWAGWAMLAFMVLVGAGTMTVLWPIRRWGFGPSPTTILRNTERDIDQVLRAATQAMIIAVDTNSRLLARRMSMYQATVIVLLVEVVVLVVALILGQR